MEVDLIFGFILASLALAIMPGPDNIYVLTESINKGFKQGLGITLGLLSGVLVHTSLVATGLSLIIFDSPLIFNIFKFLGAAYLLFLAFEATKSGISTLDTGTQSSAEPFLKLWRRGFLMNVLNPKVSVFFIVLLPQFVTSNGWPPFYQLMVLGVLFIVCSFLVFGGIAFLAGKSAQLINNRWFWVISKWLKVIILLALAFLLVTSNA
jgi:threonine/homoserine/homoserine lactone efflux protein